MSRLARYGYLGYFALLLVSFLPYLAINRCYIDELTLLAESKRVLMGEHQHRDFFSFYGGLNYYLIAMVWKLIGSTDYQAIKLLTFIVIVAAGILLTVIARRFTSRFWLSLLPSLIYVGYLGHTFPFTNHHWFGSAASVLFLYFLVRYLENLQLRELYLCGVTAALSLLFIMHEGIVNCVAGACAIVAVLWLIPVSERRKLPVLIGGYLAGFATLMLPMLAFYAAIGAVRKYIYNTFIWPFTNYVQPGSINNQFWAIDINLWTISDSKHFAQILFILSLSAIMIMLMLPLLAMLASGAWLTAPSRFAERRGRAGYLMIAGLLIYSIGLYATAFSQPTLIKLLWGSVPAMILTILLLDKIGEQLSTDVAMKRIFGVVLLFMLIAIATVPIYRVQKLFRGDISELAGAEVMRMDHPVIELINRESGREDYYFGYKWASLFYYAVDARPATPYVQLVENYLSREQLQDLYTNLALHRPKFITFNSQQDLVWLVSQNENFPKFLNDNYQLRIQIENWLVYQRKD